MNDVLQFLCTINSSLLTFILLFTCYVIAVFYYTSSMNKDYHAFYYYY